MVKKIVISTIILGIILFSVWFFLFKGNNHAVKYKTVKIERGSIESQISATGTLNAVVTVQIGSQISGTIKELYADFNSIVKQGQIIALLDQKTFIAQKEQSMANLMNATANVEKVKADLMEKKQRFNRITTLSKEGLVSLGEKDTAEASYLSNVAVLKSAEAQVAQFKAALKLAEVNLEYTIIKSPVDGVVISRNVDVGQTVAASFQTPTLFTIARDLSKMRVNTNIDEADIGVIRLGQDAEFTVDAYPEQTFKGVVSQIRNSPQVVQNVVTYDVIIDVANSNMQLKPGMTANVSIVTSRKDNVLKAPNIVLRFKPAEDISQGIVKQEKGVRVWLKSKDAGNEIIPVFIKTGISDGNFTEILEGDIKEGDEVIVGITLKKAIGTSSPSRGRMGLPGFHR